MRAVFMGTPDFALPVLESLLSGGCQVAGVYTRPDQPAGRGRRPAPPPVKTYALSRGLPVFQPRSLRREEAVQELASLQPEVIVVAAYGRILPSEALAVPPLGVLNIHPSLLPKYRGPSPVITALLEGESVTGVTVMLMDEGMDTGSILAQRQTAILPHETAGELTHRLFRLGAELLLEVLPEWTAGAMTPVPQDEAMATITRLYTKEDGDMDWSLPAVALERRLCAFQPWPGCYTRWEGKLLRILEGAATDGEVPATPPGQVVALPMGSASPVAVATGKGILGLRQVQLEGRKAQAVEEFLRGYPRFVGAKLPS
ncbi:MAG: methionyl-tRNA formyltransferase [Chloroflexota bacterium]